MGLPPTDEPPTTTTTAFPPPSYSEATTTPSSYPSLSPATSTSTSTFGTTGTGLPPASPLTTHLRALPARFRTARLARQSAQAADELGLAALMVPRVEQFLVDLTASGGGQQQGRGLLGTGSSGSVIRGELTLVPRGVVPVGAKMSGLEERIVEGEVVEVGFVDVAGGGAVEKGGKKGDGNGNTNKGVSGSRSLREQVNTGFDEWGRFDTHNNHNLSHSDSDNTTTTTTNGAWWWFRDEDMAGRLAAYLRPEPVLERKQIQATVVQTKAVEKEKSGWSRWGLGGSSRKKSLSSSSPAAAAAAGSEQMPPGLPSPISPVLSSPVPSVEEDAVRMTVTAEEVTFRKENEFGVWESLTGWGGRGGSEDRCVMNYT